MDALRNDKRDISEKLTLLLYSAFSRVSSVYPYGVLLTLKGSEDTLRRVGYLPYLPTRRTHPVGKKNGTRGVDESPREDSVSGSH